MFADRFGEQFSEVPSEESSIWETDQSGFRHSPVEFLSFSFIQFCDDIRKSTLDPGNNH